MEVESVLTGDVCSVQTAYSASKAGLNAMSEGLRRELKPFGIDVVIIAPGMILASDNLITPCLMST